MSVRAAPLNTAAADLGTAIAEVQPEAAALAEGNSFATQSSENPLTRHVVVSIRASLNGAPVPFKNPRAPHAHTHTHPLVCSPTALPLFQTCASRSRRAPGRRRPRPSSRSVSATP